MNDALPSGSRIHLIAICGVGMASLAGLLQAQGYRVSGSDENVYPPMSTYLESIGIPILCGYRREHIEPRPDLVIVGNAVSKNNPEVQRVLEEGIPYVSFPDAVGKFLIGSREALVVAGTHGKTTTTALAAWVLKSAGIEPGFFIGGVPLNFGSGWHPGNGRHVVIEGDEYDSAFFDKGPKFLHYRPRRAILTSLEYDHADIYRDLDQLREAFRRFVELIPVGGLLIACYDDGEVAKVARAAACRVVSYGEGGDCDWSLRGLRPCQGKTIFEPCYRGSAEGEVEVGLIGRHNMKNALAVYALGREMGLARQDLLAGFGSFTGVKRRQEVKGERRGVLVIDDFAHHPTAVRETIDAVKAAYPGRRLWAVFEPRSNTSRRRVFAREFAEALAAADRVVIAGLYLPEKIPAEERLDPVQVVEEINRLRGSGIARHMEKNMDIPRLIAAEARARDVILVMSNGGFDNVQEKILRALEASES
ncbi:MAG TPA: UDP-N-acetylmuramate:L-alanyl-gamma-D-glutamyl-meso-diaminopimelate ligase [Candidatus Eisenbacteria bacterium]|nr:UDP-N-acetylmuramate:L-alanyl-gamma-D-glutamyl-meso-diaminopimelate ligase [Candidatus Eisenbacteria bacterium]